MSRVVVGPDGQVHRISPIPVGAAVGRRYDPPEIELCGNSEINQIPGRYPDLASVGAHGLPRHVPVEQGQAGGAGAEHDQANLSEHSDGHFHN